MNKSANVRCFSGVMKAVLPLALVAFSGVQLARASGDPYSGYSNTVSYLLPYASGTSFAPTTTQDVRIAVTIAGKSHVFNVDTGSRGLYVSSAELGDDFKISPNAWRGEIDLDSSGRVSQGWWTPATLTFKVKDSNGNDQTVTSTPYILDVIALEAQLGRTASFGIDTTVKGYDGTVKLVGGGTVPVTTLSTGQSVVYLKHSTTENQRISYAGNIKGLIKNVSNFGIGFDLSGAPGGTGPVGDNMCQIYNPLINLDKMKDGTLVGGYIIKVDGIQLGLTDKDKGYAYTPLTLTGLTSAYSAPDWQTAMGQTTVKGVTNGTGSIVMDSGIGNAFISAPSLTPLVKKKLSDPITVSLMNSGGAAGYHIDLADTTNVLNPTSVLVVAPGTKGTYPQGQPPYQGQFLNTGRNVFKGFNMLYDAENGYMGVLPNSYGATDSHVFFKAKAGGYPNPLVKP